MHCSNLLESFPGHLAVSSEIPALCRHHWTLALRPLHCDLGRILLPRSKLRHRHLLLQPRGSRHQNEAQPVRPVRPKNKVRISYEIYDCTKWWDLTGVLASLITVFISFSTLKNVQAILLIMNQFTYMLYFHSLYSYEAFDWSRLSLSRGESSLDLKRAAKKASMKKKTPKRSRPAKRTRVSSSESSDSSSSYSLQIRWVF